MDRTRPHGRVIGIDLIPAQPPSGIATFQGDFLSPMVRKMVKDFIIDSHRRIPRKLPKELAADEAITDAKISVDGPSYIDRERHVAATQDSFPDEAAPSELYHVDVSLRSSPLLDDAASGPCKRGANLLSR